MRISGSKALQIEDTSGASSQSLQQVHCAQGTMKASVPVIAKGVRRRMLEYAIGGRAKARARRPLQAKVRILCVFLFLLLLIFKPLEDDEHRSHINCFWT